MDDLDKIFLLIKSRYSSVNTSYCNTAFDIKIYLYIKLDQEILKCLKHILN